MNKTRARKKNYLDYVRILNKVILCLILLNAAYFVMNVNDLSIKGFVLNSQKAKLYALSEENRNFELQITELSSLESIEKRAKSMRLVKVDKIDYLTVNNDAVAMK